jgi:formyltetrahydrofolate deformylase
MQNNHDRAILLMYCPDKQGIVAQVTEFLNNNNGNIIDLEQHVDRVNKVFFMRIEWEIEGFLIPKEKIEDYFRTQIAQKYNMTFNLYFSDKKPRMAVFVSKMSHCLYDILSRVQAGEWEVEVPLVISNHTNLQKEVESFGIPYYHIPVNKENKKEQEKKELDLLKKHKIDFVVLARYMQILSEDFIKQMNNRVINIHHSFLPAFAGAKPYHAAYERGVKIIGATSHYVTSELDAGPIIEQDVVRITHRDNVKSLIRKGRDLEKIVLSKAVFLHLQRRLLVYNNKTIVFS